MSRYYGSYSQYLGSQRCCDIRVQGEQGPVGPQGPASIGPMGHTGSPGQSLTGPTGKGCRGPTGPSGGPTGEIGPTGPPSQWILGDYIIDKSDGGTTGFNGIGYTGNVGIFGDLNVSGIIDPEAIIFTKKSSPYSVKIDHTGKIDVLGNNNSNITFTDGLTTSSISLFYLTNLLPAVLASLELPLDTTTLIVNNKMQFVDSSSNIIFNNDTIGLDTSGNLLIDPSNNLIVNGDLDVSGNLDISGKLTVDGLIDPTGVQFTLQSSNPGTNPTIWYDLSSNLRTGSNTFLLSDGLGETNRLTTSSIILDSSANSSNVNLNNTFLEIQDKPIGSGRTLLCESGSISINDNTTSDYSLYLTNQSINFSNNQLNTFSNLLATKLEWKDSDATGLSFLLQGDTAGNPSFEFYSGSSGVQTMSFINPSKSNIVMNIENQVGSNGSKFAIQDTNVNSTSELRENGVNINDVGSTCNISTYYMTINNTSGNSFDFNCDSLQQWINTTCAGIGKINLECDSNKLFIQNEQSGASVALGTDVGGSNNNLLQLNKRDLFVNTDTEQYFKFNTSGYGYNPTLLSKDDSIKRNINYVVMDIGVTNIKLDNVGYYFDSNDGLPNTHRVGWSCKICNLNGSEVTITSIDGTEFVSVYPGGVFSSTLYVKKYAVIEITLIYSVHANKYYWATSQY